MTKFISVHVVACLTRQAITDLIDGFKEQQNDAVQHVHSWCDTMAGRMINEWRAADRETLVQWLEEQNVRMRGDSEWIMQVQFELDDDSAA